MSVATPTKDSLDGRISAPADRSALMLAAAPAAEADRLKMPHGGGGSERGCRERRVEPGRLSRRTSELPTTSSIDAAGEAARGVRMPASVGWHVLQVVPGQEQSMAERAASLVGPELLSACSPLSYQLLKKQQGTWRLVTEVMFPGYVFLATGDIDAVRERLKLSTSFARLLGAGDAIFSLTPEESAFVSEFGGAGHVVGMSEGVIEDGRTVVRSGPLRGREGLIRKIDRHKRVAYLDVGLLDQVRVRVGLEITRKT